MTCSKETLRRVLPVLASLLLAVIAYRHASLICAFLAGWLLCAAWRAPVVDAVPLTADQIIENFNAAQARNL